MTQPLLPSRGAPQCTGSSSRFWSRTIPELIHDVFHDIAARSPIPFEVISAEDGQQCWDALQPRRHPSGVHRRQHARDERHGGGRQGAHRRQQDLRDADVGERQPAPHAARAAAARSTSSSPSRSRTEQVMAILKTYCRVTVPSNALVVDNSATVRRIIKKVFANSIFNIDVTEAGDGQTALDLLRERRVRRRVPRLQHAGPARHRDARTPARARSRREGRS